MTSLDYYSRRLRLLLGTIGLTLLFLNFYILSHTNIRSKLRKISVKVSGIGPLVQDSQLSPDASYTGVNDRHPIAHLMQEADAAWQNYVKSRSRNFKEAIIKYREIHGRHPPPGFEEWYRFAVKRGTYHIDDYKQVMDDLRPFWAIEPYVIRSQAAHLHENPDHGISGLHIRNQRIWKLTNSDWRMETFSEMVNQFVKFLPDMDVAMNRLDQPRIIVPWNIMQDFLAKEKKSRNIFSNSSNEWTKHMNGFLQEADNSETIYPDFFAAHGKQYMDLAREACPPESPARNDSLSAEDVDAMFKTAQGGFITNFNLSSDLCTVGPALSKNHGFLFAPSTIWATRKLLPIFGESKVSTNSDILFPANMYYRNDVRYTYDSQFDFNWDYKNDSLIWRGVTSGGAGTADNWREMHRQRLVLMTNATVMADKEIKIMKSDGIGDNSTFLDWSYSNASGWIKDHTNVGFTGSIACVPNCEFYEDFLSYKPTMTLSQQFVSKYLVDVDGHSFSGRWRAFLQSKSLGIKSTIFREWHDSRLFAWRHFVPLDGRYSELYSLLTYFIGLGSPSAAKRGAPYVQRHDYEGRKMGQQGRDWAQTVLRREDMEYARIIDDNRDVIGYSGDGSELADFDEKHQFKRAIANIGE
ncbi:unnamed protein product [Blumeria hordei]|uniref:Glycosyl transferase CAP10 domain-containing protein n=1 Tax=Blumeria hordei TaxID=2867405 RepID=A0A383UT08_BLUHO|nr:unnamed protein product [Blumeria hordei]